MGGALARLGQRVSKFGGATPPMNRNMVFRKSRFGWVRFHRLISVISGPKFTEVFSTNAGGIVVQNVALLD